MQPCIKSSLNKRGCMISWRVWMWNWIKYESKFLGKSHCHLQNEAFAIVRGEEGRKNIMLEKGNTMDRSALAISKPSGNEGSAVANAANSGRNERKKTSEKDSLWSSYCKKNRHTRETCWKLHGKPLNFFKGNGGKGVNSGYKSQTNLVEIGGKHRKKALAKKWSSTRRKLTNSKDSFPS